MFKDSTLRNKMIVDYMPLAYRIALSYRDKGIPTDELKSIALEGLIKAWDYWDDKYSFSNAIYMNVKAEIRDAFRKMLCRVRLERDGLSVYTEKDSGEFDNHIDEWPDTEERSDSTVLKKELQLVLQKSLDLLPVREQKILHARYIEPALYNRYKSTSFKDLGKELDISMERVRQLEVKALKNLRKSFEQQGITLDQYL